MSLAWSSIALLIMLLPGFLFFFGLSLPERFSRETAVKNPLGQLAALIIVSLVVHGFVWLIRDLVLPCSISIPCIDLETILRLFQLQEATPKPLSSIAANLEDYHRAIFAYISATALLGATIGAIYGRLIVRRPRFRRLAQHSWIYELNFGASDAPQVSRAQRRHPTRFFRRVRRVGKIWVKRTCARDLPIWLNTKSAWNSIFQIPRRGVFTFGFVMTTLGHEKRKLLYRGYLYAGGLNADGTFSYIVLQDPHRFFMLMEGSYPETTPIDKPIGATHRPPGFERELSLFVVAGNKVENSVFERFAFVWRLSDRTYLLRVLKKRREAGERGTTSASPQLPLSNGEGNVPSVTS